MIGDPLSDAGTAGLSVEVARLGEWGAARLVSEYDRRARTVRVDAVALEIVRSRLGAASAGAFLAAAVAHELYHHRVAEGCVPRGERATHERNARRYAEERYGIDPSAFEAALR